MGALIWPAQLASPAVSFCASLAEGGWHRRRLFRFMSGELRRRKDLMPRGKVKWFNDQKGFGFIAADSGKDVFVHHSVIQGEGFRTLQDGELVEYEFEEGPKGAKATLVRRPETANAPV